MTIRLPAIAALALALVPFTSASFAQTTTMPSPAVSFIDQQPAGEWLAHVFVGTKVRNATGEIVGDINDLIFTPQGKITSVVLGVGGFLGVAERNVAVPFDALKVSVGPQAERIITIDVTKDALSKAPQFKPVEMTTLDKVETKAGEIGKKVVDKAIELKDKAAAKIDDMKKSEPAPK